MTRTRLLVAGLMSAFMLSMSVSAGTTDEATRKEFEELRKELAEMRKRQDAMDAPSSAKSSVDKVLESKYGPNAPVTTRTGKLEISGLLQVWYYTIENTNRGLFNDRAVNGIPDTNETQDNDSFRIRRAEIKFSVDVHENIKGVIMIDPAREATSFPNMPANQGLFKRSNNVSPEFDAANGPGLGSTASVGAVQAGAGTVNRMLQDAYINFHDVVPHHDFQIGQFKPAFGEEGIRNSGQLDFVERSMIGITGDSRDLGIHAHGSWWDDRVQYWISMFDGAGTYLSSGNFQNRSDDNDEKDYGARLLVRPLWGKENKWGQLELGGATFFGHHGESGGIDPVNAPVNGLNRKKIWATKTAAWLSYFAGGPATGLWLRGEWARFKDRNIPGSVVDLLGAGGSESGFQQTTGNPVQIQGWYGAMGYRFGNESWFCKKAGFLKNVELAARFDAFENVMTADLVNPRVTDVFQTKIWTVGINYYIKGHDAKFQLNYNIVNDPDGKSAGSNRKFHEPENNSLMANFQVAF